MLARLEANRQKAKMAGVEKLINANPEYLARLAAVQNLEQRHQVLREFCDSHIEEIKRISERIDSGRPLSPVNSPASNPPAGPSAPRPQIETSTPRPPVVTPPPRPPDEAHSPRPSEESATSRPQAESSIPRTPEKMSTSSQVGASPIPPSDFAPRNLFEEPSSSIAARDRSRPTEGRQPADGRQRRPDEVSNPAAGPSLATVQSKSKSPDPTGWSLNEVRPRYRKQLSNTAERKANLFEKYIRQGFSPADAASKVGPGSMLKLLNPSTGQYEIRLNQHDRLTFLSDEVMKTVTILEIGGHT
jgi:hypothetical protein